MAAYFHELWKLLQSGNNILQNHIMNKIIKSYSFHHISQNFDIDPNTKLYKNMQESSIIIINQYTETDNDYYFIIGFEKTIIFLDQSCFSFLENFSNNPDIYICFLNDSKKDISKKIEFKGKEITFLPEIIEKDIESFSNLFKIIKSVNASVKKLWDEIIPCISKYLINKSYHKSLKNRVEDFLTNNKKSTSTTSKSERIFDVNDYIELRTLGNGSVFCVKLIYDIENEELLALKQPNGFDLETPKLSKREYENYSKLNHSFLPKYIGKTKKNEFLVIEFINGKTIDDIKNDELSYIDKISIIFELMIVIEYFHRNHFVLRDLKPNNAMIDENKNLVLIDFDRVINMDDINNEIYSHDFASFYIAPEVYNGNYTYKSDIYSLGMMMYYIMTGHNPEKMTVKIDEKYSIIEKMIQKSTLYDVDKRPNILELIYEFYINFDSEIKFIKNFNIGLFYRKNLLFDINSQILQDIYNLGIKYSVGDGVTQDVNKAIHYFLLAALNNFPIALCKLSLMHFNGAYVKQDMNKAFKYLKIALHQNFAIAQCQMGSIYYNGSYLKQDINKAIYYFTLAANQGETVASYNLGIIYLENRFVPIDIKKAIYYLNISSNHNNFIAQNLLGHIYNDGDYVKVDLKKAFNYFLLAANQNFPEALFYIGCYYEKGLYVAKDINKAIDYYLRASKQNYAMATHNLGNIYDDRNYGLKDNDKAIYYYTISANQGVDKSQYNLGLLYLNRRNAQFNVNKAIHYLTLAANQNHPYSLFKLGYIYNNGYHVKVDIKKAIHYYSLSANMIAPSLLNLAIIYYENKYVHRDMNKVLFYLEKAANPKTFNNLKAQLELGFIYYYGRYIAKDIYKAIFYYKLAANQNSSSAQFSLGLIYETNNKMLKDFNKSLYYYNLASNQNHAKAQANLGFIYYYGENVPHDINKAIYYFTLSANLKCKEALFMLGVIYLKKFITDQASHDFSILNKKQNITKSNTNKENKLQFDLLFDKQKEIQENNGSSIQKNNDFSIQRDNDFSIQKDNDFSTQKDNDSSIQKDNDSSTQKDNDSSIIINKSNKNIYLENAIKYFSLAANLNHGEAQYFLGIMYYEGQYISRNINKGRRLLIQSTLNEDIKACFYLGFLYHVGENIPININKAIELYKKASTFNHQYAKNNLGIIYKNGYEKEIKKDIGKSIEYFKEAININNDVVSIYNLSQIYIFEQTIENNIDKAIEMLINSLIIDFVPNRELLCLAIIKKFDFDFEKIKEFIEKINLYSFSLLNMIQHHLLLNKSIFEKRYIYCQNTSYMYNNLKEIIPSNYIHKENEKKLNEVKTKNISQSFYDGFSSN